MSRLLDDIRKANDSSHTAVNRSLSRGSQRHPYSRNKQELELEALRQRGLTKLLNRHFTEAARHVASERAAADAARKDLEHRRAQALLSRTSNSPQVELSPLDAMYLKVNKLQKETRRKERETLLMYQRYVDTFKKDGKSHLAKTSQVAAKLNSKSEPKKRRIEPTYPNRTYDTDRSSRRQIHDKVPYPITAQCIPEVNHEAGSSTADIDARKDGTCTEKTPETANDHDSIAGVHGPEGPLPINDFESDDPNQQSDVFCCDSSLIDRQTLFIEDDMVSLCSGLTLNSEQTRQVLHECEGTVARFLQREHAEVRKLMIAEEDYQSNMTMISCNDESTVISTRAADHAETIAKKMKSILDKLQMESEKHSIERDMSPSLSENDYRSVNVDNITDERSASYENFFPHANESTMNRVQWDQPECCTDASILAADDLVAIEDVRPERRIRQSPRLYDAYRRKIRKTRWRRRYLWIALLLGCSFLRYFIHCSTEQSLPEKSVDSLKDVQIDTIEEDRQKTPPNQTKADEKGGPQNLYQNTSIFDEDEHGQCIDFYEALGLVQAAVEDRETAPVQIAGAKPWFRRIPLASLIRQHYSVDYSKTSFDMESFAESILQ